MLNEKFSCYVIGEESLLIQCAEILLEKRHDIRAIISKAEPIAQWAKSKNIPVLPTRNLADTLSQHPPFDYFLSITNLSIIPDSVLTLPRRGAINFHDGPLPHYPGLYATSWALINQEPTHGVTWHTMTADVDKGEILKQQLFPIAEDETAFTINVKAYEAGISSFTSLVEDIENNTLHPQPQSQEDQPYYGKYKRPFAAATIDFNQPAKAISALVRSLNFNSYPNPLTLAKLIVDGAVYIVPEVAVTTDEGVAGTITEVSTSVSTAVSPNTLTIATASGSITLSTLLKLDGTAVSIPDFTRKHNLKVGSKLTALDSSTTQELSALTDKIVRQEAFWNRRLARLITPDIPYAGSGSVNNEDAYAVAEMPIPSGAAALAAQSGMAMEEFITAVFAAYLSRLTGTYQFNLSLRTHQLQEKIGKWDGLFANNVPMRVNLDVDGTATDVLTTLQAELTNLAAKRHTFLWDTLLRQPALSGVKARAGKALLPIVVELGTDLADHKPLAGSQLSLVVGEGLGWVYKTAVYTPDAIQTMQTQFATFITNFANNSDKPLSDISLLNEAEWEQIMVTWNDTSVAYDKTACMHQLIEMQVEKHPHRTALVYEDQQISYRQLNNRANQLARHLQALNVTPDTIVGVFMERSLDLMVALIAIHKAGGAYLPLDPHYPQDRIAFMVQDAAVPVIITQQKSAGSLPPHQADVVVIDTDWSKIADNSNENLSSDVQSHHLAYVIYTSGSTGKPKGVMVEHRNAHNFFVGMDERIVNANIGDENANTGTWLAVTSLSFDISVLELFWTLARGFKVVIFDDKTREEVATIAPPNPHANKPIDFSLFYFSSNESEEGVTNKYELLLEGSKFGDKHGFSAVWTPERHFHAFGGLYPNPSVTGAAIAAITKNLQIRSGSCVLPLHSPIRVAEEWSVVDNISNGRVGLSIAAGWQPNDFVLRPGNYAERKEIMFRDIEVVKELWRGGSISMTNDLGTEVEVQTLPHPVQAELPIWVTAAGNPETFRMAGEAGYNVLTHLLGQTVEELEEKVRVYRDAYQQAGHTGKGIVSLMLHTFIGDDMDEVREIARAPMKQYLRSAMNLVRAAAWHFPTFKEKAKSTGRSPFEVFDEDELTPEDVDALLDFAFERYFEGSGLFGTPQTAMQMVNKLKSIDVDDIACLIDFGVPSGLALKHLTHLNELRKLAQPVKNSDDFSIPAQIERHGVTHFQCTPSMARMLLMDERTAAAFGKLDVMMVGGEALSASLANELNELVAGRVINMYGPTETAVWSSTYQVQEGETAVSIGTPIANTQLYILDSHKQPVPVGIPGDLYIGGDGVVRGYLNQPELTSKRFVTGAGEQRGRGEGALERQISPAPPLPLSPAPHPLLYKTGDLARYLPDGRVDFLGRSDFQVKIRGYRIEMGEIESLLNAHRSVHEAVVVAREDVPGDIRLVAYVIAKGGEKVETAVLRDYLRQDLPDFMVPAHFVPLDAFPLTPNKKTDRKALPAPGKMVVKTEVTFAAPTNDLERQIADIWCRLLNVPQVGLNDNFFDLGGHSLLTVQAHRELKGVAEKPLAITDMFRFPTIRMLVDYLTEGEGEGGKTAVAKGSERAASRRAALKNRRRRR